MEKKVLLKDLVDSGTNLRKQITSKVRVSDQGVYPIGEIWDANTTINTIVDGASIAFDTLKEVEEKLEQHDAQIAAEVARATAAEAAEKARAMAAEEAEKNRAIAVSEKGVANGVATLDSSGKVPSSQLPSYVDDVIEGYYNNGKFYENYTEGAGHDYVEIGGVKWATMNIGAENITDGGFYFQWGDTQGYIASQVGEGDGKKYFGWADYKFNPSGDGSTLTKYNNTDGKTILESSDDAVTAAWGNDWRMPTGGELQNLGNAVNAVYTQIDSVSGLKCTAKTDNTKELFFPQAGFAYDDSVSLLEGNYWSSLISNTDTKYAYRLLFRWNQTNWCEYQSVRTLGYQVRGVYTGNLPSGGGYSDELTPETGKIYVDIPTNQSYRWSGSTYIVISSPYVLPTASANTLGGVKVGDGLSIDNNGVLSAEGQDIVQTTGTSTTAVMSQNAVSTELLNKANNADLATVATSGSYADLSNAPTLQSAVQDGTALSLVTTGEKYIWNNKSSAVTTETLPVSNGVYAIYADGSLKTAAEADSDALGVAVITDDCCFVIDKTNDTRIAWDLQYSTNGVISGCTAVDSDAQLDFAGIANTDAIASVASGGEAAKYCRGCSITIGGVTKQGYLGACGEWYTAYQNKTDVNTIMTAIGGTAIDSGDYSYWSSTQHLTYKSCGWTLHWYKGAIVRLVKDITYRSRPFYSITKQELEKTITTNIPTVTIEQSTGSSTTNVMSLNAVTTVLTDLNDRIENLEENPYELPTASVNTLGGVKVGDGLSIDSNGVLSAEGGKSIEVVQTTGNSTTAVISLKGITDVITENEEVVSTALNDLNDRMIENEEIVSAALNDLNDRISSSPSINAYTKTETDLFLANKVDKVSGKGLSTNDYTTEEKNKLASIVAFSGNYKDLTFNISTASVSGVVSIDGTIPVHVLTATDNIYDLKLSSNPTNGHTCRVIIKTTNTEKTRVVVKKNSNIVFPDNTDIISAIPINGYVEIDFLAVGGKVYVYCILNPDYPMIVVDVTTTSSPTKIINNTSSISKLIIDGVEQPSVVESYQFTTTGYHFIECNFVNDVIGESAFYGCSSIKYITIPDSVTTIGNSAFLSCRNLTSVTIPNSVTSIGNRAFCDYNKLTSINIPNSVTSIGELAFCKCTGLTSVTIPDSVTTIGNSAFKDCSTLRTIIISNSVTSISNGAFLNCYQLTSVTIPDGVTTIGGSAFDTCTNLTSITIPNSVTTIGNSAFNNCSSIKYITIPDSVTNIGSSAFAGCSFTSINIPDGVTSIRDHTFLGCNKLTSISIPNSITSIGAYAFSGCNYLTSITIPDNVTTIDYNAFYSCTGLTSITIGNSVTSISGDAFNNCTSLTNITCNATTAPTIQRSTFNNVHIDGTLTVPANSTGYDTWMSTDDYYLGKYNWTMVEL